MKRPAVWSVLFLICGIYSRLGISMGICLVCISFPLLSVSYFVKKTKRPFYLIFLLFAVLGFVLAGKAAYPTSVETAGGETEISGTFLVTDTGQTSGGFQKLRLEGIPEGYVFEGNSISVYAIRMDGDTLSVGDEIWISGEALSFSKPAIPGAYNEDLYLRTLGYDCKMFLYGAEKTGERTSLSSLIHIGKGKVDEILKNALPEKERGVVKALLTGDRDDILQGTEELYRAAGITHILCISGLHISLLALMIAGLLEKILGLGKKPSTILTMAVCACFLVFTGFSPSSVRAVIMIFVALTGRLILRRHDWLNNIALAALIILLLQPLYLWNAGFQLSFLSVTGIWAGSRFYGKRKDVFGKVWDMLLVSFFAFLFTFPVTAYHFYHITPLSILANLVVIPFSGLLLASSFLTILFGLFSSALSAFAAGSAYIILQIYEGVCLLMEKLPFSYPLTGSLAPETMLLYYGFLLVFLFWDRKAKLQTALLSALATVLLIQLAGNRLFQKENTITFLDVGQGDCALLTTYEGNAFLIDGGGIAGKELGENVGEEKILPYLEYLGIKEIDGIFLSHMDTDHILGALEVMEAIPVKAVYLPDYAVESGEWEKALSEILVKKQIPLYTVKEGDTGDLGEEGSFLCLYPIEGIQLPKGDANAGSMVLKYTYGGRSVLFTGDLETGQEGMLLQKGADLSCDVLKVAHHGSAGSSSAAFLEAAGADMAVISCGKDNFYGHPAQDTLERMEAAGIQICRTDQLGSILVYMSPSGQISWTAWGERNTVYERIKEAMETGGVS